MRRALRVYSETAPYEEIAKRGVLRAFAQRELELVLGVRPWDLGALEALAPRIRDENVRLSLWPMVADEDGRFLHVGNVARVRELTFRAIDACTRNGVAVTDVMLDLEPPVQALRALRLGSIRPALRSIADGARLYASATHAVHALRRRIADAGATVSAAVAPHVLIEEWLRVPSAMASLGTVGLTGFANVDVMAYTTLLRGYTFGLVDRKRALAILRAVALRAAKDRQVHLRVALGCVGLGAMGDEPVFASPEELAEDVRVARAAGATELALLDLGGVLARGPSEPWLDAFCTQ